jgi:hypothetical protein
MEAECMSVINVAAGSHTLSGIRGNPRITDPAQLLLECKSDGRKIEVNIFPFFRGHFSKFTKERIKAIRQTMPKTVTLEKNPAFPTKDNESQYRVIQENLDSWLKRVNESLTS